MRDLADIALRVYNSVMRYERQKGIQSEMDARIPRGLSGSPQNLFRFAFYNSRCQGLSFDESVEKATAFMQQREPGFSPTILPPSRI